MFGATLETRLYKIEQFNIYVFKRNINYLKKTHRNLTINIQKNDIKKSLKNTSRNINSRTHL